jgi:hypothetical protein
MLRHDPKGFQEVKVKVEGKVEVEGKEKVEEKGENQHGCRAA